MGPNILEKPKGMNFRYDFTKGFDLGLDEEESFKILTAVTVAVYPKEKGVGELPSKP